MKEEEARKKWCPMARIVSCNVLAGTISVPLNQTSFNRLQNAEEDSRAIWLKAGSCITSECVAWRWKRKEDLKDANNRLIESADGYCGLAGKES